MNPPLPVFAPTPTLLGAVSVPSPSAENVRVLRRPRLAPAGVLCVALVMTVVARAHITGDANHDAAARLFAREFPSASFAFVRPAAALAAIAKPVGRQKWSIAKT